MPGHVPGQWDDKRRSVRVRPSGLVSRKATIYADQKGASVIECTLIDISAGGACLETIREVQVPPRFILNHGGIKKRARLVWKKGQRFGVAF